MLVLSPTISTAYDESSSATMTSGLAFFFIFLFLVFFSSPAVSFSMAASLGDAFAVPTLPQVQPPSTWKCLTNPVIDPWLSTPWMTTLVLCRLLLARLVSSVLLAVVVFDFFGSLLPLPFDGLELSLIAISSSFIFLLL
ncbi:hypothetical protein B0T17DRAFT_520660, partial [Bombardia bombarda]